MAKARRAAIAPRLEPLEPRTLLSGSARGDLLSAEPDPATSLLIRFDDPTLSARDLAALATVHARPVRSYPDGPTLVTLPTGADRAAALRRLGRFSYVRYAEPDATIHVAAVVPNDLKFPFQWGLSSPNGVDIDAPAAWQLTTGNPTTVVAVIDSGIDVNHPDLAGQLWNNPVANVDGYPGDYHGWNFVDNNGNIADQNGHGTHVAGIIAAAGNNGYGVAGVDWGARLMVLKFIGANGDGSVDDAVRAIYYAVQHGARVINASWGGDAYDQSLVDAISYAGAHNVVFVTAAGNDSVDNDVVTSYPASVRLPNTISVAAVDQSGNLADFSNYGARTVDIAAPGVNILSDYPGGFEVLSGTSMSAPFVTGVVALLAGQHPEYTAAQLVQRVVGTARPLPTLTGLVADGGIVDAAAALGVTGPTSTRSAPPPAPLGAGALQAALLASDEYFDVHGGTTPGFVAGLFQDVMGRAADPGELIYWSEQIAALGLSRFAVAQAFLSSPEGQAVEVARWFTGDLGWPVPPAALAANPGIAGLGALLGQGVSASDLRAMILSSDEFFFASGGSLPGYIAGLFQDVMGRAAGPTELIYWTLQAATQGLSRFALARAFLDSPEGRATQVAQWFLDDLHDPTPLSLLKVNPGIIALSQQLAT